MISYDTTDIMADIENPMPAHDTLNPTLQGLITNLQGMRDAAINSSLSGNSPATPTTSTAETVTTNPFVSAHPLASHTRMTDLSIWNELDRIASLCMSLATDPEDHVLHDRWTSALQHLLDAAPRSNSPNVTALAKHYHLGSYASQISQMDLSYYTVAYLPNMVQGFLYEKVAPEVIKRLMVAPLIALVAARLQTIHMVASTPQQDDKALHCLAHHVALSQPQRRKQSVQQNIYQTMLAKKALTLTAQGATTTSTGQLQGILKLTALDESLQAGGYVQPPATTSQPKATPVTPATAHTKPAEQTVPSGLTRVTTSDSLPSGTPQRTASDRPDSLPPMTPDTPHQTTQRGRSPATNYCDAGYLLSPWPYKSKPGDRLKPFAGLPNGTPVQVAQALLEKGGLGLLALCAPRLAANRQGNHMRGPNQSKRSYVLCVR